jgi:Uma2 family endonuclease
MGMALPVYYTADMVRALPDDGNRYEVVYGELLVTPAPRAWHQILVLRLAAALQAYLERNPGVGIPFVSPADISWGEDVLLQPDVFVVPVEQARTLDWSAIRDLLLVAEVLSPSTPRHDRFTKRRRYQEARVPLYWIIDGNARQAPGCRSGCCRSRTRPRPPPPAATGTSHCRLQTGGGLRWRGRRQGAVAAGGQAAHRQRQPAQCQVNSLHDPASFEGV